MVELNIQATDMLNLFLASLTLLVHFYLAISTEHLAMTGFMLTQLNLKFGGRGKIKDIQAKSKLECAVQCLTIGCSSFSFNLSRICTLNHLHMTEDIDYQSELFESEEGTQLFTRNGESISYLLFIFLIS